MPGLLALAWQHVLHAPLRFWLPLVVLPLYRLHSLVFQFRRRSHNKPRYDHRRPTRLETHRPALYKRLKVRIKSNNVENDKCAIIRVVPFLVSHEVIDDPCRVHRLANTLPLVVPLLILLEVVSAAVPYYNCLPPCF